MQTQMNWPNSVVSSPIMSSNTMKLHYVAYRNILLHIQKFYIISKECDLQLYIPNTISKYVIEYIFYNMIFLRFFILKFHFCHIFIMSFFYSFIEVQIMIYAIEKIIWGETFATKSICNLIQYKLLIIFRKTCMHIIKYSLVD